MSTTTTFYLDHRPDSYWDHPDLAWSQTAGTIRRLALMLEHQHGVPSELPDEWRETHISSEQRNRAGRLDPAYRGGEDLPEYAEGEVEIARLRYTETVHCEVTSIRARRRGGWIKYRVVGEYPEVRYKIERTRSEQPLTLRELVRLIDGCSAGEGANGIYFGDLLWRVENKDHEPHELEGFIVAESPLYPTLEAWYGEAFRRWVRLLEVGWAAQNDSLRLMAGLYESGNGQEAQA